MRLTFNFGQGKLKQMGKNKDITEILKEVSPLARRALEIETAGGFVTAIAHRYGQAAAAEILAETVREAARRAAETLHRHCPQPTLADLYEVWQKLGGEGRLELVLDELTPGRLRFRITRCAYAEAYRALGLEELGYAFSCQRDEPFARALLPGVTLKQSPTIMIGREECCFEYILEPSEEK
jgi:hypothetical protein